MKSCTSGRATVVSLFIDENRKADTHTRTHTQPKLCSCHSNLFVMRVQGRVKIKLVFSFCLNALGGWSKASSHTGENTVVTSGSWLLHYAQFILCGCHTLSTYFSPCFRCGRWTSAWRWGMLSLSQRAAQLIGDDPSTVSVSHIWHSCISSYNALVMNLLCFCQMLTMFACWIPHKVAAPHFFLHRV